MKHRTERESVDEVLDSSAVPHPETMHAAIDRVWHRVREEIRRLPEEPVSIYVSIRPPRSERRRALLIACSALTIVVATLGGVLLGKWWNQVPAVRIADSGAAGYGASADVTGQRISATEIDSRQVFSSDDRTGTTLVLPDESRVEMRARTELFFEKATDGLRIQLSKGSILVNAAKQRSGHLYVQTKDLAVSVVGTVFLVRAEQQGSRVAVIEGEVRVKRGTTTERLIPGEQVTTSSLLSAPSVVAEISWSQHAAEHFALLQQRTNPAVSPTPEPADRFDVASIRPNGMTFTGEGARGGGGLPIDLPCPTANPVEMDRLFQLDPGRLVLKMQSLYGIIALAYGSSCPPPNSLTGGSDWMRGDFYDVQAVLPEGTPRYTKEELLSGNAPRLQRMLQHLLADRFKLVLKREVREAQGYDLVIAQEGKLKPSADQTPDQPLPTGRGGGGLRPYPQIPSLSAPISRFLSMAQRTIERPIVDKTGLTGLYDIWLEFPEIPLQGGPAPGATPSDLQLGITQMHTRIRDLLPAKLEAATGLRLVPAKVPVEVLVIVSADRPSEN